MKTKFVFLLSLIASLLHAHDFLPGEVEFKQLIVEIEGEIIPLGETKDFYSDVIQLAEGDIITMNW